MSIESLSKTDDQNSSVTKVGSKETNFFDTSHLKADIKGHSVRGGAVTVGAQAVKFVLQAGSTAILARLLTPADFGLIAMVSVFTEFVNLFKDLGLSTATIQKKNITHQQVSNLFWVNIMMSCLLMVVAAAISSFVARFYNESRLTLVTIAIGSTFIFGGLVAQHTALMRRQMRFRTLAVIEIISMTASIIAAIIAALSGLTYWSLVIMTAVRGMSGVVLVWWQSSWRPGRPSRGSGVRPMLAFGGSLTGSNIISYFIKNTDNGIIGYALGPAFLGIYTKAYGLLTLPMSQFNAPLRSIMIPALSRIQDEPKLYSRYYLKTLGAIALITMPMVTFLFISADDVVSILLGSKWTAVAPVFRILAPAALFSAISFAPGWLFITLGRAGTAFCWNILTAPVIIIGFFIGVKWGVNGVAASFSMTYSILMVLGLMVASHKSPVRFRDIIKVLSVPMINSILAALGTGIVGKLFLGYNVFIRLMIYSAIFVLCYVGLIMSTSTGRQLVYSIFNALSALRSKPITSETIDQ